MYLFNTQHVWSFTRSLSHKDMAVSSCNTLLFQNTRPHSQIMWMRGANELSQNRLRTAAVISACLAALRRPTVRRNMRSFTVYIRFVCAQLRCLSSPYSRSCSVIGPGFPIWAVSKLNGQPKRDGGIIVRSCKASQSPVYPIRDAILAVNHATCPSLSSSGPPPVG